MSPDLEWRIDDQSGEQTIARTTPPRSPRWLVIGVVVMLGIGLGVAYRSIPEPASLPTPTPSPTVPPTPTRPAVPARLYEAIEREVYALADGDAETYLNLHIPVDEQEAQWRRLYPQDWAWGRPSDDRPIYTIIDFNLRTSVKARVDIRQFRNGRYFRETRFYVWNKDRWLRSDPDPFFWSDQVEALDTPHLHVIYAMEDRELIPPVVAQLETIYARLCDDLGCTTTGVTYTLKLNSGLNAGRPLSDDGREIRFPSPRVMGVYEDAQPIGHEGRNLIFLMAASTARRITDQTLLTQAESRAGDIVLWMIAWWAAEHALDLPFDMQIASFQSTLPLADLWGQATESNRDVIYREADLVVHFIAQEYGAQSIGKLLKAMNPAKTFSEAIEKGLGVPFAEFDQKWQNWVEQNRKTDK